MKLVWSVAAAVLLILLNLLFARTSAWIGYSFRSARLKHHSSKPAA